MEHGCYCYHKTSLDSVEKIMKSYSCELKHIDVNYISITKKRSVFLSVLCFMLLITFSTDLGLQEYYKI